MRFLLFGDEVMPLYQRVEENINIAKRMFLNFNDFMDRHYLATTHLY